MQSNLKDSTNDDSVIQRTMSTSKTSIVIFSKKLTEKLDSSEIRISPPSIGVRRVRPSSKVTRDAFKKENNSSKFDDKVFPPIVFKITDENGVERRMTNKEKKEYKLKLRRERQEQKLKMKNNSEKKTITENGAGKNESTSILQSDLVNDILYCREKKTENPNDERYYQLPLNKESIQNELAELRGERGIPPVLLSQAMTVKAIQMEVLPPQSTSTSKQKQISNHDNEVISSLFDNLKNCTTNDKLASHWAILIKKKLISAENLRKKDPNRPMPYQLVPELWTRLRPSPMVDIKKAQNISNKAEGMENEEVATNHFQIKNNEYDNNDPKNENKWAFMPKHFPSSSHTTSFHSSYISNHDQDKILVFQQIHRLTNIRISCGAKFGCDFLLYDGHREDRHAFAGLRVVSSSIVNSKENVVSSEVIHGIESNLPEGILNENKVEFHGNINKSKGDCNHSIFPIPSPYDLAGYVRGLNTAGKLALLATVVRVTSCKGNSHNDRNNDLTPLKFYVCFVDLALEKILSAPTHKKKQWNKRNAGQRHHSFKKRKQVGLNLDKSKS